MIGDIVKGLISPVTNIADKLILDKDKYAELKFRELELREKRAMKLLTITTTPKIDAVVKILYTIKDVIIPMFRPLGAAAMTAFGVYAHLKGLNIDPVVQGIFDGAFPAWGLSRHVNKQTDSKQNKGRNPVSDADFE